MIWKTKFFLLFSCILFSCNREKGKTVSKLPDTNSIQSANAIIEVEDFITIAQKENIKLIDFRKEENYLKGHIPNALNLWRTDIENKTYPYKGMSADKASMEKLLQSLGIEEDDIVVVYDDMGLCDAARLWWVLKSFNFNTVKLLNGGWQAWNEIEGETTAEIYDVSPSKFQFSESEKKTMYIDMADVSKLVAEDSEVVFLDTRTVDEYTGERMKKGAVRSGRIPQSHHIDWMNAVDKNNNYKFKKISELEEIYAPLLSSKDVAIVAYCHTGVRSAHTTFVLTQLLGYTNVKNYDGSWSEWSYFENLPIEKDSITTVLN